MLQLSAALMAPGCPVLVGAGGWLGMVVVPPVGLVGVVVPVGVAGAVVPVGVAVVGVTAGGVLDGVVLDGVVLDGVVLEPLSVIPAGSGSGPPPPQAVSKAAHTTHKPENNFSRVEILVFMKTV
jgi:hypothetical protein